MDGSSSARAALLGPSLLGIADKGSATRDYVTIMSAARSKPHELHPCRHFQPRQSGEVFMPSKPRLVYHASSMLTVVYARHSQLEVDTSGLVPCAVTSLASATSARRGNPAALGVVSSSVRAKKDVKIEAHASKVYHISHCSSRPSYFSPTSKASITVVHPHCISHRHDATPHVQTRQFVGLSCSLFRKERREAFVPSRPQWTDASLRFPNTDLNRKGV
jgi:hypothetical protein